MKKAGGGAAVTARAIALAAVLSLSFVRGEAFTQAEVLTDDSVIQMVVGKVPKD